MYQIDYHEIEQDVFNSHNDCRSNPFNYIIKLREITNYFKDKLYHHPLEDPIETHEGIDAVEDAMNFLKSQKPVFPLEYSEEISKACRDHISDIGPKGLTTHEGSDGKNITDRIEKYCEWDGMVAENLDFGFRIGDNVVMNMLVDDGIKEKLQRKNILSKEFKYIGVGAGPHKIYGICVVVGYAKNIREIGSQPENVSEWIYRFYGEERKDEDLHTNVPEVGANMSSHNIHRSNSNTIIIPINEFKFDEPDAPDSSISLTITKNKKIINGEEKKFTKKTYLTKRGYNHIIEIEE